MQLQKKNEIIKQTQKTDFNCNEYNAKSIIYFWNKDVINTVIIVPNNVTWWDAVDSHPSNLKLLPAIPKHVGLCFTDDIGVPEQSFWAYLSTCICPLIHVTFVDVVGESPAQIPGK